MKHLSVLLSLTIFFSTICLTQATDTTLPQCALDCMTQQIPLSDCTATNQTCICTNTILQTQLSACVTANCSVIEALTTQNTTATTCAWPYRDQSSTLRNVSLPLLIIATIFIAARVVSRLPRFGGTVGSDDYMIMAAWVLSVGFTVLLWMLSYSGLGKDVWTISPSSITQTLKLFTALEKTYIPTVWLTKLSILLLYLRLFPHQGTRTAIKIGLCLCSAAVFCLFWACVFKCWPVSYSWTYWDGEHEGKCSSMSAQGWANSSLNMFADVAVLLLPVPTVWKLRLSMGKKLGILAMFGVGLFVTVVSMIRLKTMKYFTFSANATWDFVQLSLWSAIEIHVGIICACMPGMRALFTRIFKFGDQKSMGPSPRRALPVRSQGTFEETKTGTGNSSKTFGSGGGFRGMFGEKHGFEMMETGTGSETDSERGAVETQMEAETGREGREGVKGHVESP